MKKTSTITLVFLVLVGMLSSACAVGGVLRTHKAQSSEIAGSYTLILYGSRHASDIESVAILDREGDQYTVEPFAPAFDYKIKKEISGPEAIKQAEEFVKWHPSVLDTWLQKIIGPDGSVIGYELRPLYRSFDYGTSDVLDISYRASEGTVKVYIKLKPEVERMQQGDDGRPFGHFR